MLEYQRYYVKYVLQADFDLLLNRFVRVLVEHKKRRNFLFALGLDHFNVGHARYVVEKLDEHLSR